jgi:hypothetical protein
MAKKLLLIAAFFAAFAGSTFAQCVINTSYTQPGYYPDSAHGIPPAFVGISYNTTVQVKVVKDTTVQPYGAIHVNYVQMDSIRGLPSNFMTTTNPANGNFPGGSNGCILIYGTATVGQNLGGPTSNGVYPITVYYHSNDQIPGLGAVNVAGKKTGYRLNILPASAQGVNEAEMDKMSVFQNTPNPSNNTTEIQYWMPTSDNVEFRVFNVLGNLVSNKMIHSDKGNNKFTYETASLAPGIYLYSLRLGQNTITKRMVVSAH